MVSIFISYSRKDEEFTKILSSDIQTLSLPVWFDQELTGGQIWWDKILEKIRACDAFIFVLSNDSLNSTACKKEYNYAIALNKTIIPVLVDKNIDQSLVPNSLSKLHFVDYSSHNHSNALILAKALMHCPKNSILPDILPPPPEVPISYLNNLLIKIEEPYLTFEQQSALLLELKQNLNNKLEKDKVLLYLLKLQQRTDLYAKIDREINEIILSSNQVNQPSSPNFFKKQKFTVSVFCYVRYVFIGTLLGVCGYLIDYQMGFKLESYSPDTARIVLISYILIGCSLSFAIKKELKIIILTPLVSFSLIALLIYCYENLHIYDLGYFYNEIRATGPIIYILIIMLFLSMISSFKSRLKK